MRLGRQLRLAGLTWARLALIAAGVIAIYSGFEIVGNNVHQYQLDRQSARLAQQVQQEQERHRELEALKAWMQSDDFVIQAARLQGYIFPGDKPLLIDAPSATPTPDPGNGWWQRYLPSP